MEETISRVGAGIVTIILAVVINYFLLPAWTIGAVNVWLFFFLVLSIGVLLFGIAELIFCDGDFIATTTSLIALLTLVVALGIGGLTSSHMFNASNYHNIVDIEDANFEDDIPKVTDDIPVVIVDVYTAQKLGDRTVGNIANPSWYEVDNEYNLIKYKGGFYRISELNYSGFWQYLQAKNDGIPGYVLVNVETQEAEYVELEEPIKYSPSACFSYDLKRHLRGQYLGYIFGTSFFEIDEEGNPYYITSVQTPTIGLFGGKKENSFIITNASTGTSKEYKTEDLPEWVDHAYDLEYLMRVINDNQIYVNGWFNSFMGQTGVNITSYQYRGNGFAGYNTAITSDGNIVFYTGVTPASNVESNIGFILANPRTGKISYYDCAGAEEESAQQAAESLVQNLGYTATFPTILNVDGAETYFMLLKDKAGLVQRYALCNIKDYAKVVQAEEFDTALTLYKEEIGIKTPEISDETEIQNAEGIIQELYQAEIDGCTFYYFKIEGNNNLYMSSIKNSNKQVLLKIGTKVTIEYINSSEEGVFIVKKIQF